MSSMFMKRHKGNITFWATGYMWIITSMVVLYLLITHVTIDEIKCSIEDIITSSVLSAALIDNDRYAISGDLYIQDYEDCMKRFEHYFSELEGIGSFDSSGRADGPTDHTYLDFRTGDKVVIKKFIIYNVSNTPNDIGHLIGEQYTFDNGHWAAIPSVDFGSTSNPYVKTPLNKPVINTCIYVEMELPINAHYFGIKGKITKAQTVAIETK